MAATLIRPTMGYPGWASGVSGAARITQPTQTEKNIGWQAGVSGATGFAGGVPPSTYFNWLHNLYYQWIVYLDKAIPDGQVTVKSLTVDGVGSTATNNPLPGTVQVQGAGGIYPFGGGATGSGVRGASHALGTVFKDNVVNAWGIFSNLGSSFPTGVMNVPTGVVAAFGFHQWQRATQGHYRMFFQTKPQAGAYPAAFAQLYPANPGTGAFKAWIASVSDISSTGVEVKTYDMAGTQQDFISFLNVSVVGGE